MQKPLLLLLLLHFFLLLLAPSLPHFFSRGDVGRRSVGLSLGRKTLFFFASPPPYSYDEEPPPSLPPSPRPCLLASTLPLPSSNFLPSLPRRLSGKEERRAPRSGREGATNEEGGDGGITSSSPLP